MKLIITALISLLLVGCVDVMDAEIFYYLEPVCDNNDGVNTIERHYLFIGAYDTFVVVHCNDGATFNLSRKWKYEDESK